MGEIGEEEDGEASRGERERGLEREGEARGDAVMALTEALFGRAK